MGNLLDDGDLDDVDLASSYNNMGVMYYKNGDNDKSLNCFQEALRIRRETLDDVKHEKIGDTLHNMGLVYKNKEDHDNALKHYKEALEIRREKFTDGHPKTADTLYNIGTLYTNNHDFQNALIYYEQASVSYSELYVRVFFFFCIYVLYVFQYLCVYYNIMYK